MSGADVRGMLIAVSLTLISAIIGFLVTRYWERQKGEKERISREKVLEVRIAELEHQVTLLGQTVVPITTAFQQILIKTLTHDHSPELDKLLEKIGPPNILTDEQNVDLLLKLKEVAADASVVIAERNAAEMLPMIMARIKDDEEGPPVKTEPKLVSVPQTGSASERTVAEKKSEERDAEE